MIGLSAILLGLATICFMIVLAAREIDDAMKVDKAVLDTKMFWYIVIPVFTPIMLGLCLFGWYALRGEYDRILRSSGMED